MPAVRPVGSARRRSRCPSRPVRSSWGSQRVRDTMPVRGRARPPARQAGRPGGSSAGRTRPATPGDRRPDARRPRRGRSCPHRASAGGTSPAPSRSPTGVPRWSTTNGRPSERTTRASRIDAGSSRHRPSRSAARVPARSPRAAAILHRPSFRGWREVRRGHHLWSPDARPSIDAAGAGSNAPTSPGRGRGRTPPRWPAPARTRPRRRSGRPSLTTAVGGRDPRPCWLRRPRCTRRRRRR